MNKPDNILRRLITEGGWLRVFLFSLFAFCILVVSLTFFALSIGRPNMGITLAMNNQGWVVQTVEANSQGSQAGIMVGDRPVEINGQPAQLFLEKYEKADRASGWLMRELTVVDNHGQLKSVTLQGAFSSRQAVTNQIAELVACLIFWIIGFYVFFKKRGNVAALLLCLSGVLLGLALGANMAADIAVPTAVWFEVVASAIGPWLLLHFFLVLPEERTQLRKNPKVYLIYLPAAIILVLFPLIGYTNGQPVQWFRTVRLLEYGAGFLSSASVVIFSYLRSVSTRTQQQMRIVLVSCLAALIPFLILSVLPEVIWGGRILPPEFSILLIVFIPLGMGYAVVTQKLMDIDVIIRRGVIYGLITIIMASILSTAIILAATSHKSLGVPEEIALALVLGAIATALFGPLKNVIEKLVDKLFYKDRYDYRQIVQSVSTSLKSVEDTRNISRIVVGTTVNTLNLVSGCLFIKPQSGSHEVGAVQGMFADLNVQNQLLTLISRRSIRIEFPNSASAACPSLAFLIPLIAGEKEVGILYLSQKVTRQDFSSNDIFLIQEIASVAAIALHSAMLIRDVSMRDTFVSVASHELRTPLTSIMGYADLLLRRDPPDITRKRWLENILDNSQRISAIVDDLLNVSRIRSGRASIKLEKVSLSDVLEEALSLSRESTERHEFVVDIEPDFPDVLVDRDKFNQVVGNLLSNAVKYSPNGGRITLSAHNEPSEHRIIMSVADEGIGIGPEDRDLLFTTFHRIQRPETHGIRGSGLGLYIAKAWTEAMGGEIWLESELNRGSTFFIAFPTQVSSQTG
jgi:signal transduction histidine kinase